MIVCFSLVADQVVFNSQFNKTSFITNISKHLKSIPPPRPDSQVICSQVESKSSVLYFPIQYAQKCSTSETDKLPNR